MKKLLYVIFTIIGSMMFFQCSDWTEMEPKFTEPVNVNGEDYYKALRAYKKTKHPVVFGWYSGWTGTGADMNNQLRGVPDSMDIISLWEGAFNLTEEKRNDLKEVREKKGTRVVYCQFAMDIGKGHTPLSVEKDFIVDGVKYKSKGEAMGAYWGWYEGWPNKKGYGDTSPEGIEKAIRKYARVITDSITKYDYDGLDIDFEPYTGYPGDICCYPERMDIFLDELSKVLGPKSGTDRLLMVDAVSLWILNAKSAPLLDYYVIQAYVSRGDNALDQRFEKIRSVFGAVEDEATTLSKIIWCENFEAYKSTGGPEFTTRNGIKTYSLKGMAMYYYPGVDVRIGGVGAFRFNLCRPINDYLFMREAIQELNPAKH